MENVDDTRPRVWRPRSAIQKRTWIQREAVKVEMARGREDVGAHAVSSGYAASKLTRAPTVTIICLVLIKASPAGTRRRCSPNFTTHKMLSRGKWRCSPAFSPTRFAMASRICKNSSRMLKRVPRNKKWPRKSLTVMSSSLTRDAICASAPKVERPGSFDKSLKAAPRRIIELDLSRESIDLD
jgi:hypothetical protein